MTEEEVRQATSSPMTKHETTAGVIVCRDPQIEFDEKAVATDNLTGSRGYLREHLLVDAIVNKTLLGKSKSSIDALFRVDDPNPCVPDQLVQYNVAGSTYGKCGAAPQYLLQAYFGKDSKLVRYRSRYCEYGLTNPPVDSIWIK
ncbi:MAG TPA: hypothetical protein V6C76_06535 [Drouetiella sp.]